MILSWLSGYIGIVGMAVFLGSGYIVSTNRRAIAWSTVMRALALQFLCALGALSTAYGMRIFAAASTIFQELYQAADAGISFLFGNLANASMPWGMIFAVKVIPVMIFFGAFMAFLSYTGITNVLVRSCAFIMKPILASTDAEALALSSSCFLGQTEVPLLIKSYLEHLTTAELFTLMVTGMAHLSGAIIAVYGSMGIPVHHLLIASIMAVPGSYALAQIMVPAISTPVPASQRQLEHQQASSIFEALAIGTIDGLRLACHVAAILIAFVGLMALLNKVLIAIVGYSLENMFGIIFYGVSTLIGIPTHEAVVSGSLIGTKSIINEFIAFSNLITSSLSPRSTIITIYALAGFSNLSSLGIQIGCISALCPQQRSTAAILAPRALLAGMLVNFINACIISLLV